MDNLNIVPRKYAIKHGLTFYFTGKPCKNGHVAKRLTDKAYCFECSKNARYAWKKTNGITYEGQLRRARRKLSLELLGGKCVKCGFSDTRALQIDHVNGGGTKERVKDSRIAEKNVINGNTTDYQLLCANCNWIKRFENKEH
jgi:hypothetical protein